MKDDDVMIEYIEDWASKYAATKFRGRCKQVDWVEWDDVHGKTLQDVSGMRTVPFEKQDFILRQEKKFGRIDPRL